MLSDILNIHHDAPCAGPTVGLGRTNVISDYISLILGTEHPQAAKSPSYFERKPGKKIPQYPFMCCQTVFRILARSSFLFLSFFF